MWTSYPVKPCHRGGDGLHPGLCNSSLQSCTIKVHDDGARLRIGAVTLRLDSDTVTPPQDSSDH